MTFAIDTNAITASSGAHGSISPTGATSVNYGVSQEFTITPDTNYHVADVLVDSVSQGAISTYTFTNVITTHTISVTFAIDTNAITASAGAHGSISPTGATSVNYGASQEFTITPDANYHVSAVLVDSVSQGAISTYTFTNVTTTHTISVAFAIDTNAITATAGINGAITPSGTVAVNYGADQQFSITPDNGYHIDDVLVDSVSQGDISTYTFSSVTTTHTIIVSFAANPIITYTITASVGENGSISPSGSVSVSGGDSQLFAITADTGYHIDDVLVDSVSQGSLANFTFSNVSANHTISVTFVIDEVATIDGISHEIIVSSSEGFGTISPVGRLTVHHGSSKTFSFTPTVGYHLADVLVDGLSAGTPSEYTFKNIIKYHTIKAVFESNIINIIPDIVSIISGESLDQSETSISSPDSGKDTAVSPETNVNSDTETKDTIDQVVTDSKTDSTDKKSSQSPFMAFMAEFVSKYKIPLASFVIGIFIFLLYRFWLIKEVA